MARTRAALIWIVAAIACRSWARASLAPATGPLPRTNGDATPRFPAYSFTNGSVRVDGTAAGASKLQVSKLELAKRLDLPLRDLRLVDASIKGRLAAIAARRGAVLVSLGTVKAVLQREEALVSSTSSLEDLDALEVRVRAHLDDASRKDDDRATPFHQVVLEACVQHAVCSVRNRLGGLQGDITEILAQLRVAPNQRALAQLLSALLPLKNELDQVTFVGQEVARALNEVLMNDEDLDAMQLVERPNNETDAEAGVQQAAELVRRGLRKVAGRLEPAKAATAAPAAPAAALAAMPDHADTEMLLEAYLTQLEALVGEARDLAAMVRNTEEIVELQIAVLRNRILSFELRLEIATLVMGAGCFITGLFGMNLLSHLEQHPAMFWLVAALLFAGMGSSFSYYCNHCRARGLLL